MPQDQRRNRLKLLGSLAILAVVLVVAAISQFEGRETGTRQRSEPVTQLPRAVFGGDHLTEPVATAPVQPAPAASAATPAAEGKTAGEAEGKAVGVDGLLSRWRASVLKGDVDAQTILYAPRMEHFFRKRNVSRATVRREKARMMELYPRVDKYDISDVRVTSTRNNEAVVTFRKDWDMRGERRFTGAEQQRLKLRKIHGDWKIVSEEETRVYWLKRG
jgi:hypothetical protein